MTDDRRSIPTEATAPCARCGALTRWFRHQPDAVNPVGLWHHENPDLDYDHGPEPVWSRS